MKSKIVTTQKQAEENILRFEAELEGSNALVERAAYARAWYAFRDEDGIWRFGPSKFIGYQGMTAKEYLNDKPRDGRVTERKLQEWFTIVGESDKLYPELVADLNAFLANFDKVPSSAFRINIAKDLAVEVSETELSGADYPLADLIIAVAKKMSKAERNKIKLAI